MYCYNFAVNIDITQNSPRNIDVICWKLSVILWCIVFRKCLTEIKLLFLLYLKIIEYETDKSVQQINVVFNKNGRNNNILKKGES